MNTIQASSLIPEPQNRTIRAPRGSERTCSTWQTEAAMRMLMNNLDPEVAEHPESLIVYGGRGQAARSWEAYDAIIATLKAGWGHPNTQRCTASHDRELESCPPLVHTGAF